MQFVSALFCRASESFQFIFSRKGCHLTFLKLFTRIKIFWLFGLCMDKNSYLYFKKLWKNFRSFRKKFKLRLFSVFSFEGYFFELYRTKFGLFSGSSILLLTISIYTFSNIFLFQMASSTFANLSQFILLVHLVLGNIFFREQTNKCRTNMTWYQISAFNSYFGDLNVHILTIPLMLKSNELIWNLRTFPNIWKGQNWKNE